VYYLFIVLKDMSLSMFINLTRRYSTAGGYCPDISVISGITQMRSLQPWGVLQR
jgi:hypothetical protein